MTDLPRALQDFVSLFEEQAIAYVLMGGLAVRVYGIPRATYDIDFTVALDREDLPGFYRAVEQRGYTVPEAYRTGWVDRVAGMAVIKVRLYLEGRGVDVDMFLAESEFQQQVLARRRRERVDDLDAWLVSPEDLVLLKLIAHRPRDLADVGDILFTQGQLDEAYLRHWAKELGILAELERQLAEPAV